MPKNLFSQVGSFAGPIKLTYTPSGLAKVRQKVFFNDYEYAGPNDPNKGDSTVEATVEYYGQKAESLAKYAAKHTKLVDGKEVKTNGTGLTLFHAGTLQTVKFNGDTGVVKYNVLNGKYWDKHPVLMVTYTLTLTKEVEYQYREKEGSAEKELIIDAKGYFNQSLYDNDKKNRSIGPLNVRFRGRHATILKNAAEAHQKIERKSNKKEKTMGKGMRMEVIGILMQDDWQMDEGGLRAQQRIEIVDISRPRQFDNYYTANEETQEEIAVESKSEPVIESGASETPAAKQPESAASASLAASDSSETINPLETDNPLDADDLFDLEDSDMENPFDSEDEDDPLDLENSIMSMFDE